MKIRKYMIPVIMVYFKIVISYNCNQNLQGQLFQTRGLRMKQKAKQLSINGRVHNLAYGVSYLNQSVYFKIVHPSAKECYVNLYHKINDSQNKKIQMQQDVKNKETFVLCLDKFPYSEYEYCFEADGEEFLDPTVKVVYGREEFGDTKKQRIRGGFLSETPEEKQEVREPIDYRDMIMYKLHVRGFTQHKSSKVEHPGTYLGVVEKIPYLKELGINCILFMPFVEYDETFCPKYFRYMRDRINYWGFGCESFYYAPKTAFAFDREHPDLEVKYMIQELHRNGIEVILEMNFTLQVNPVTIADCLSYWKSEYQVDGFKTNIMEQYRSFIAVQPVLKEAKLLDQWWNLDEIRFFTGGDLPNGLAQYNDGFMCDARRFLRGDEGQVGTFIQRVKANPTETAIINYVTNHDGFTLADLFSYDIKHNEENGENNHDGREYNYSWNCGAEGTTRKKKVVELRKKMVKNAFASMLFSQGTPMILSGDEFGNTQEGNNNVYCQDNEISWLNWDFLEENREIFDYVKTLIRIRMSHPILHPKEELRGADYIYCGIPDISFHGVKAWQPNCSFYSRELGILFCGKYAAISRTEFDQIFYVIYNMHDRTHGFDLPKLFESMKWGKLLSSEDNHISLCEDEIEILPQESQRTLEVHAHTMVVLVGVPIKD